MKNSSLKIIILLLFLLISSISPIFNPYSISKNLDVTPIFTDSFENKINTESSLTSPNYKETIKSSNKISFTNGKVGLGVHLDSLSSYIGYSSKYINSEEGTIRFYFKPDSNFYDFYNTRQPEWKDFGSYKSPFEGLMIDTVGYLGAFSGAFRSYIDFSGDKSNKNISILFVTWSGSNWSQANFTTKNNFILSSDKFYDFAFTWSKSEEKIKIYIDGELKATGNYNTLLNNKELFFIGHNPFQNYWPYGPHSLIGTYDELKIYNVPLKDFGITPPSDNPNKPPRGLRAYPGDNKVLLEWDPPEDTKNLTGYYLYRSKQSGQYISPAHNFSIEDTKYIDENVENGTTYYYVCKVVYQDKTQSPQSNEVMVTPKQLTPIINITDNQKVSSSSFTFTGKVDIGSKVFVNGNEVSCDSNGNFTATVTLNKGSNTITIEVRNKPGDYIKITKIVIYEETSTPPKEINENEIIIILQIDNPYMTVNGVKKEIDPGRGTVPVIIKGRSLVPIRAIIEELGGTVDWDGVERKVTIKFKDKTIELWIDKKVAKVNGTSKELDVPPMILNGRTMLPLRFVTEELGCAVDWNGDTKTVTITYKQESQQIIDKISSEGEKIFTSSGGELILSDGTKLSVSPNSFSKDTKVTLKSIINPSFSSIDTLGFEITGLKDLKGEITLYVNGEKNLKNEELNIFGYDFDNDEKIDFNYNYEPSSGLVTIKISPLSYIYKNFNFILSNKFIESYSKILGFKEKLSVYVGWVPYYTSKSSEKIIRTPYCEQIGGSCASTCAQMLLKYSGKDIELFDILKEIKPSDTDFGLDADKYAEDLRNFLSLKTGYPVIHIPYFGITHLEWRVLEELDKGHPVILNWGKHVVLVLGYTNNGNDLIIHDPANMSPATNDEGTMYTVRSWDWIKDRHKYATEKYLILYPEGTFAVSPSLSLMCPSADEINAMTAGELSFYILHPNTKQLTSLYQLQIKPSNEIDGYIWSNKNTKDKVDFIPNDAETLKLKLNSYNGLTYTKNIEIQTAIEEDKDGNPGKKLSSNNQKFSIGEARLNNSSTVRYDYEYKVEDLRDYMLSDKDGKQKILIHATLWEDTSLRDFFIIKATLSNIPKITSIDPTTGGTGDYVNINGFAFGKNKSTKSKVTINDKEVEILNWSDKKIQIKISQDVDGGSVVVYTGEKYEYVSNKDVIFNTKLKCDGYYEVYCTEVPSWNNIDCKWVDSKQLIRLCVTFKDGKIFNTGPTCYNASQEVSGTYDNSGNINFTFTWKSSSTDDTRGFIVTGNFTGKFVKGCTFNGTAQGTARAYDKSPIYCKPYDIKKEFTSPMFDKNYKP
ncbi:MAG TPA: stalk domain-containing protein [Caldisericia bacterium]|nr:stalk domain-containing protein [Caldisericia bacterium]HQL66543.1 stalk domain-containing protein [Caldisericia bacterium]